MLKQQARSDRRSFRAIRRWFTRNAPELQFWGYEGGNILAAIAGVGGFAAFTTSLAQTISKPNITIAEKFVGLVAEFPDAAATIGLAMILNSAVG